MLSCHSYVCTMYHVAKKMKLNTSIDSYRNTQVWEILDNQLKGASRKQQHIVVAHSSSSLCNVSQNNTSTVSLCYCIVRHTIQQHNETNTVQHRSVQYMSSIRLIRCSHSCCSNMGWAVYAPCNHLNTHKIPCTHITLTLMCAQSGYMPNLLQQARFSSL